MEQAMVKLAHNPFTPTFGCVPPELAGRDTLITDILEGLDNAPGDPNRATIFVGARGTGKTVLLTAVAERAEMRGWVSVNVTDRYGMLSEIIVQLRQKASHLLTPETYSWLSGNTCPWRGVHANQGGGAFYMACGYDEGHGQNSRRKTRAFS